METKILPVRLTDLELLERGQRVAELLRQVSEIEEEKKATNSDFKARIEEREGELHDLGSQIRNKAEQREVEVMRQADEEAGIESTIRVDTGEVIGTRAMTPTELAARRQGKLALLPDAKAEPEA